MTNCLPLYEMAYIWHLKVLEPGSKGRHRLWCSRWSVCSHVYQASDEVPSKMSRLVNWLSYWDDNVSFWRWIFHPKEMCFVFVVFCCGEVLTDVISFRACVHEADGHLPVRSREASKLRYSGLGFSNCSENWQALPRCLSNFGTIRSLQHPISRLRYFARFGGKTFVRLVNRGLGLLHWHWGNHWSNPEGYAWINPMDPLEQDNTTKPQHITIKTKASQIASLTIVYSTVYSRHIWKKHQNSVSLAFGRGNSPVTGEFPPQKSSNAENISIWWRHHDEMNENRIQWIYKTWRKIKRVVLQIDALSCVSVSGNPGTALIGLYFQNHQLLTFA